MVELYITIVQPVCVSPHADQLLPFSEYNVSTALYDRPIPVFVQLCLGETSPFYVLIQQPIRPSSLADDHIYFSSAAPDAEVFALAVRIAVQPFANPPDSKIFCPSLLPPVVFLQLIFY
jgi:hypothetical protein